MQEVRYFTSYAHGDKRLAYGLQKLLETHFGISRQFTYQKWRDDDLLLGEGWHEGIQTALAEAPVALLFVSPTFLSRKYIRENELPKILNTPGKIVLPVVLKPIDFANHDLQGLEVKQMFQWQKGVGGPIRAYSECTTAADKEAFALALFLKVEARLKRDLP